MVLQPSRPAASKAPLDPCIQIGSKPYPMIKKHQPQKWLVFFWQRMRDSNPRKRSQSPVCYRYTNPLYGGDNRTRTCDLMRVKHAL